MDDLIFEKTICLCQEERRDYDNGKESHMIQYYKWENQLKSTHSKWEIIAWYYHSPALYRI